MDGRLFQRTISRAYLVNAGSLLAEFLLLAGIGAAGVIIHAYLRTPLKIPGNSGVIYMALLISGKLISKRDYAASLSSIGAAATLIFPPGFHNPFMACIYLFPGYIVDILFYYFKKGVNLKLFLTAVVCGAAFTVTPLVRILIDVVFGFPYNAFRMYFLLPLLTHFVFGFTGGFIAAGCLTLFRKRKK